MLWGYKNLVYYLPRYAHSKMKYKVHYFIFSVMCLPNTCPVCIKICSVKSLKTLPKELEIIKMPLLC